MNATLISQPSIAEGTFGELTAGSNRWASGELPWKDNIPVYSCIPAGVWNCLWLWSDHWGRSIYHVVDVPGRVAIEIHPGNFCGDTTLGWESNVDGCCLLGVSQGVLKNKFGTSQQAVLLSARAIEQFEQYFATKPFTLTVTRAL